MKMVSSLFKTLFLLGLIALIAFAVQTAQVRAASILCHMSISSQPPPATTATRHPPATGLEPLPSKEEGSLTNHYTKLNFVREGRRPGIAYDAENCEANSAEVMLIVQVSV
ncbi:unnamed protein product [Prunus armeniaca]